MMAGAKRICVMGLGYIGLPTASFLATKGHQVLGVDVSERVVRTIGSGDIHIKERDLDVVVRSAVNSGNLRASLGPEPADIFILAVPTPFREGKQPDLDHVEAATRAIAPYVAEGNIVILESTSPVGATEKVARWLAECRPDLRIGGEHGVHLAHCPERVLPGRILIELVENDRIVGGLDEAATTATAAFYRTFVAGDVLETNSRTAELAKLTENAFRDVNIALANELSVLCDKVGINVWELIKLANHHPRVNILQPGCGVGGHCIAVDPWFIVDTAERLGDRGLSRLMETARHVNDAKPAYVVGKVEAAAEDLDEPVIACLGLAYKPDVDDTRESPAVVIAHRLAGIRGARVVCVDPYVDAENDRHLDSLTLCELEPALDEADVIVALVAHAPFKEVARDRLAGKRIVDVAGLWRD